MVKGNRNLVENILLSTKEVIYGKSVEELILIFKITDVPKANTLSNYQARIWYTWKKQKMGAILDRQFYLRAKAEKAFNLRNEYRSEARKYMANRKLAGFLEKEEKNLKWEELLERTLKKEGIKTLEQAYERIIKSAKTGRDPIDDLFKLKY